MTRPTTRRRAATLVEFAFVAIIALLFMFGIFEYARFVFLLQVTENAAREGARFAVVRTGDGTTKQDIIDEVTRRMAGRNKDLDGYNVEVFNVDPSNGTQVTGTQWTDASFGNSILLRITGDYHPVLPTFLRMPDPIPVRVTAMMNSEAN